MSIASTAARLITCFCKVTWPDEAMDDVPSPSTMAGHFAGSFDGAGYGSHKYIPADEYTEHLGEPKGAGVYGYWRFSDGSLLLLTCKGPLAILDEQGLRWEA